MSDNLSLNLLIARYNNEPNIFNALPELKFIIPIATKIKAKGCSCGMGSEIKEANKKLNELVVDLNQEQVIRFKVILGKDPLCFGVQTQDAYTTKCY